MADYAYLSGIFSASAAWHYMAINLLWGLRAALATRRNVACHIKCSVACKLLQLELSMYGKLYPTDEARRDEADETRCNS